jgi:hypothetical protein
MIDTINKINDNNIMKIVEDILIPMDKLTYVIIVSVIMALIITLLYHYFKNEIVIDNVIFSTIFIVCVIYYFSK